MDGKTKILECLFTWQIDEKLTDEFEDSDELPLFAFIDLMTTVYLQAKNNCSQQILQNINTLDKYYREKLDEE